MVLKNLVRYLINKYLKDYIEQLDYEKLKLDLKNERLHLKPEALVDLSLPVTVATGFIEKLTLIIPWKNLYHQPTKVFIDGFYMLIVPKNEVRRDFTDYYEDKMRRVQRKVDNLKKALLNNKKIDEKELTFFERMRLQIMRNLQIFIQNLHISYETISTTKLGHPFSFGLTIHQLDMTTTTNHQPIGRIKENSLVIFKLTKMNGLSLYWNTKCKSRIDMSFDDVVADLKSKIATDTYIPKSDEMNYILHPMNLISDLTLTLQPGEHNYERPSYDINIDIEELNLNIDPKQFSDLLDFIKFQNYTKLYDRCHEYRDLQIQQVSNTIELTSEQKERIQYLETKLDVFNLAYIRHSVEIETNPILLPKHHSHRHGNHHRRHSIKTTPNPRWWNSWWKTKTHSKEIERRKSSISISNGDFLSEDSPNIDIKVKVQNLLLNLTQLNQILCPIKIQNAVIVFKRRAVSSNILFLIDLQSLCLYGMQTDNQYRPVLVTEVSQSILPLIHVELEFSPLDKKSDYRFCLIIEPLKISYDAPTINQIVECFDPNTDQFPLTCSEIKQRTSEEMEEDLSREKMFDMLIQLKGISLILPENGVLNKYSSMIHIDFNNFILKSCLDDDKNSLSQELIQQLRFYTKYQLKFHDLRITYSQSEKGYLHILKRIPLIDINFYKCIYTDHPHLFDWRVVLTIDKMGQIELSKTCLIILINHLKTVPLLYSNLMETFHRINLYFSIFPPNTTMDMEICIQKCCLLFTQLHASILTDIHCHISKTRTDNDRQIYLKNLTMSHPIK